jgi:hypothetical protein
MADRLLIFQEEPEGPRREVRIPGQQADLCRAEKPSRGRPPRVELPKLMLEPHATQAASPHQLWSVHRHSPLWI